jgi:hypothetical protein
MLRRSTGLNDFTTSLSNIVRKEDLMPLSDETPESNLGNREAEALAAMVDQLEEMVLKAQSSEPTRHWSYLLRSWREVFPQLRSAYKTNYLAPYRTLYESINELSLEVADELEEQGQHQALEFLTLLSEFARAIGQPQDAYFVGGTLAVQLAARIEDIRANESLRLVEHLAVLTAENGFFEDARQWYEKAIDMVGIYQEEFGDEAATRQANYLICFAECVLNDVPNCQGEQLNELLFLARCTADRLTSIDTCSNDESLSARRDELIERFSKLAA